ncbi:8085_t:CDS:1, partial [Funneliformis geosporum]
MIWWVENVWSRRTVDSSNSSSLLVLDSFCGHLVSFVKQKLHEKATDMVVIPDGLTSKLQPLDVSINKSFKSNV